MAHKDWRFTKYFVVSELIDRDDDFPANEKEEIADWVEVEAVVG